MCACHVTIGILAHARSDDFGNEFCTGMSSVSEMQRSTKQNESKTIKPRSVLSPIALLMKACSSGDVATVVSLITDYHVSPSDMDKCGQTPLKVACEAGHIKIVKHLIEKQGVDPASKGGAGRTALHYACSGGDMGIIRYLVNERGLDPNSEDVNGNTPLYYGKNSRVVGFLVRYCDVNHRNNCNSTVLHNAACKGQMDIVEYLITHQNCDAACKGKYGLTPLHCAATFGHVEVVKYLVNVHRVDPSSKDDRGLIPFDCAKSFDIKQFLKSAIELQSPLYWSKEASVRLCVFVCILLCSKKIMYKSTLGGVKS